MKIWKTTDLEKRMSIVKGLEDFIARQPIQPVKATILLEKMLHDTEVKIDKKELS